MILARLAQLPAAAAAATAGLAGLSGCFLTTAGDCEAEAEVARFRFAASGVVVTSTALRAGAFVAASRWRPLVITDAGERERAERELRERSTRVSTGFAWAGAAAAGSLDCGGCWSCFRGEAVDFWLGGRRMGSDLRLFLCDSGFTAVGGAASLANRTHELLVDRVVAGSFSGWWFSESLPYPVAAVVGGSGGATRGCPPGGWGGPGAAASTCPDRVMRGGPLGFLLRVGRGGGLGESSVSEDDTSLH